ncbi:hypothetical protein E1294_30725 [Nonomuraea diastatica]|uniref:Uncharacterized protein n=2 Tax=Nonomuraea diastatica TaxID=1848329 RepID=A0A4R4WCI9_9ACTN|nr:hypothetical protein E1294_30725 [Nonomuraea diastatica]
MIAVFAVALLALATLRLFRRSETTMWPARSAWTVAALLLLAVPDARLLVALVNVLMLRFGDIPPMMPNQIFVLAGAFAWWRAAQADRPPGAAGARPSSRERRVWLAAVVLPLLYAARQLTWALGIHVGVSEEFVRPYTAPGARLTEAVLGSMTVAGALLTLGLRQKWGSRVPRWSPILPCRPVPVLLVVIPGGLAAIILSAAGLSIYRGLLSMALGLTPAGPSAALENWAVWLPTLAWLPWGLALGIATMDYHRRRRATASRLSLQAGSQALDEQPQHR